MCTKIDVVEIWREYIGVEGLALLPQLAIPNKNLEETQAMLLVDGNVTTCVELTSCGNKGDLLIYTGISNCVVYCVCVHKRFWFFTIGKSDRSVRSDRNKM